MILGASLFTGCVTTSKNLPPLPPNPPLRQMAAHYAATSDDAAFVIIPTPRVFQNSEWTVTAYDTGVVVFNSNLELWGKSIQLSQDMVNWVTMVPDMHYYGTSVPTFNFQAVFARIGVAE